MTVIPTVLPAVHTVPIPVTAGLLVLFFGGLFSKKFRRSGWFAAVALLVGIAIARTELGNALVALTRAAWAAATGGGS